MSHAPAPRRIAAYDNDLYAWSQEQAQLLRAGRFSEVDALNVAEEILDVGRNEYDKLESALVVLLMHLLKWDYQPERRSRSWEATILEQRARVGRQLRDNPSLKARLDEAVRDGYRLGRLRAFGETGMDLNVFPEACPYDWDAIMSRALDAS
jgi:hypothetical protein